MKIKNISNSVQTNEIRATKYNKCYYDKVEVLEERVLKDLLTDSEYQYIITAKKNKEQVLESFLKILQKKKLILDEYMESAKVAKVRLCYFPIHYLRLDGYKYTVGFESACHSREKSFSVSGKKDHYPDLFYSDFDVNEHFYDLKNNEGDDARKEKYANAVVLSNNDMNKVITMHEMQDSDSGEVYSAEYQILQTVFYPVWEIKVDFDGEERVSYVSDSEDFVNITSVYKQSRLEEISRRVRRVRRFFRKRMSSMIYLWSWTIIVFLCFLTGVSVNMGTIIDGNALDVTLGMITSVVISTCLHMLILFSSVKTIGIYRETDILFDSVEIGERKAKMLKNLFYISLIILPIIITIVLVILEK